MEWFFSLGYLGLFIGSFLAGTVIPLSSDLLIVAMLVAGGSPWLCLVVATFGNWLGLLSCYWLGWVCKWDWLEKWFKIKKSKLEKQKDKIDKYGVWLALFPWLPIVGMFSVVALGFYKVKPRISIFFILVGCFSRFLFWVILYILCGETIIGWVAN